MMIAKRIRTKARDTVYLIREVCVVRIAKFGVIPVGHNRSEHRFDDGRQKLPFVVQPLELAVKPYQRRLTDSQMQIRAFCLDKILEQPVDLALGRIVGSGAGSCRRCKCTVALAAGGAGTAAATGAA
jgi:hypothetical protein